MQIPSLRTIAASTLAIVLTAPAVGATMTYTVSGTFADGGTFSGSFSYDPAANTFAVPNQYSGNPIDQTTGQFDITTTTGSQLGGRQYQPGIDAESGYNDVNSSTPTELSIDNCCFDGISNLLLEWNTPLNAEGGGSPQAIIGGSEEYEQSIGGAGAPPEVTRQVTGGVVELSTVPLPTAVWLMLTGLGGLGAAARKRRAAYNYA
jgi:hypothetical protein